MTFTETTRGRKTGRRVLVRVSKTTLFDFTKHNTSHQPSLFFSLSSLASPFFATLSSMAFLFVFCICCVLYLLFRVSQFQCFSKIYAKIDTKTKKNKERLAFVGFPFLVCELRMKRTIKLSFVLPTNAAFLSVLSIVSEFFETMSKLMELQKN